MPNLKNRVKTMAASLLGAIRVLRDRIWADGVLSVDDFVAMLPASKNKYGPAAFTTDGCSGGMSRFWRWAFKRAPPWEGCCEEHDEAYWRGGFYKDRKKADRKLCRCVKRGGHQIWAVLMYVAVRVGGSPIWPVNWRWGYGWSYVGRYERREDADRIEVDPDSFND